jgi:hypothetical protein
MYSFIDVVVVDIDVLGTLVVTLSFDKLKRGLADAVELDGMDVVTHVPDLLGRPGEPRSFFDGVRVSDVLSFSRKSRHKLQVTRAVTNSTAGKLEEIA